MTFPQQQTEQWSSLERIRTRPTRRAVILIGFAVVFYAAGANVQAGWVILLAAIGFASIGWAWWQVRRAAAGIAAARELPPSVTAGIPVRTSLRLRAGAEAVAVIHDRLCGTVGSAPLSREPIELVGESLLARGEIAGGALELDLSDPLGLFSVRLHGEIDSPTTVLPAIPSFGGGQPTALWSREPGGEARRAGHGSEVVGVRDYQRGDPVRQVHWRTTARTNEVVVRDLADELRPEIRIEIEAGMWPVAALDRACEAACALAEESSARGHPVEVAADGEVLVWGRRAHTALALLPPNASAPPRNLAANPATSDGGVLALLLPLRTAQTTMQQADQGGTEVPVGVRLVIADRGSTRDLGVLSASANLEEVAEWLRDGLSAMAVR